VNTSDLSLKTVNSFELRVPQDRDLQGKDPLIKGAVNKTHRREKGKVEESEVISLNFSNGIWQETKPAANGRFIDFSDLRGNFNKEIRKDDIKRDRIYYDKNGMLVIKEDIRGRFVDGLF